MSHVVVAWELGSGLGHLTPIAALGREFCRRGHRVTAVVPSADIARRMLVPAGIEVVELPSHTAPHRAFAISVNYSANLFRNGFWHRETVTRRLETWRGLLSLLEPDLLFCDHAPTALLASRNAVYARAAMGTGFTLPPLSTPMPNVQAWFPIPAERLEEADDAFLDSVNAALRVARLPPLEAAESLFDGVHRFLCVEPELDHYEIRTDTAYWGTIEPAPALELAETSKAEECAVFVYMSAANRFLGPVLEALKGIGVQVFASVAGGHATNGNRPVRASNILYARSWVDLRKIAAKCSLAITHGGTLSCSILLKGGAKLLTCPGDLEKAVFGSRLRERRLAHSLNWFAPDVDGVRDTIERILDSPGSPNVREFVARHSESLAGENVKEIVTRCEACV